MKLLVDIETPYAAETEGERQRNLLYARACMRDSLLRGEIPLASHLLYTQPGILDDTIPKERELGINAGKEVIEALPTHRTITAVYTDLGVSQGMRYGIARARGKGRTIEERSLGEGWLEKELTLAQTHAHAELWGFKHPNP